MGLIDGVGLVPLVMGLFGISEVFLNLEKLGQKREVLKTRFRDLFPTKQDWRKSAKPIGRRDGAGSFLRRVCYVLVSYAAEIVQTPRPGKAIEGVSPESANNAASSSGFIPLFLRHPSTSS
jgi:putative tricarboxylic transport membrane protein